ncbi:hypothetical protein D3C81_2011260 [compost metagenome]
MYITAENNGTFASQTISIKDTSDTTKDLTQQGYLEGTIYLPSKKEVITGGTVTFNSDGVLQNISITTETTYTSASPKTFTGTEVLKQ